MTAISRVWAQYARTIKYEDLDQETIHSAKRFLYDSMGCALGAHLKGDVKKAESVYTALSGAPQATIIGTGSKLPVTSASFINGLKIRAMDYNDIYWKADPVHPSDLLSCPIAVCEWKGLSGKDLLTATVLAYELEMRMAEFAVPGIRERGWHHATLTAFVVPVVAGMLMGLDEDQLVNAVGIGGAHCITLGGVVAGKLTNMKNTAEPFSVADGMLAALLAESGYTGTEEVLEGKEGLFHCMGPDWEPEILTDNFGKSFRINQCSMKAFPTEALTHSPIGTFITLMKENNLSYTDLDSVVIKSIERAADILSDPPKYRPESKESADHSLPFCLAAAAVDGSVTPAAFTEERLKDERIFSVIDRFKVVAEPEFEKIFPEKQAVHVSINTKDGRNFELRKDYPKGDPREPMTQDDLDAKFRALASSCMTDERMDQIKDAIYNIENAEKLDNLMALLTANK